MTESYDDDLRMMDEDGDICAIAEDCAAGLADCLQKGHLESATRRVWLETLLEAELTDIRLGGIDFAPSARDAILDRATEEEWQWIEESVRAEIEKHDEWGLESLVDLLAEGQV